MTDNISFYDSYKILYEMRKKRSPDSIKFVEDPNDSWFIYAIKYRTKSGIIDQNDNHMILKCDYDTWIRYFEIEGFAKV